MPILDDAELLPARSFGYRLWMLRHGWTRRVEAALAPTGLTHMQFFVMRALEHCACSRPSQTALSELMQVDRMTISKVVRTLEAKGLLTRAPHPADPRANVLALTAAGRALLERAVALAIAEQERFFGRLGPARKAEFSEMLDELLDHMGHRIAGPEYK